ncbi:M48 family metallopeptidase [Puia dinghuensis]|uniref:M48 family metallopeptidase n=1 Tax=Puia dinghuensis TaxID=1792502 RepID=UPI0016675C24|nr:SprT family zinc-dependent metalloprotease [Puia dinghuensis]
MQHQLTFGNRQIHFALEYTKRKTMAVKVHPDRRVEVSAPLNANEEEVRENIRKRAPWILRQIDQFNEYLPKTPPRRFISGETHLYLGRQYRLKVISDIHDSIKASRGQLWMYSQNVDPQILRKRLYDWYRQKAYVLFNELLKEIFPKFKRYQIEPPVLTIRLMSRRWGSCTTKGRIILNLELIKSPKGCIQYVITHELCHIVFPHHGKHFQQLLYKMIPDWRKWKERLEHNSI